MTDVIKLLMEVIRINQLPVSIASDLYYKHIVIVNDDSNIITVTRVLLTDDNRVIIYDCNMFIIQATGRSTGPGYVLQYLFHEKSQ